jgi:hypothetical protein
MAGARLDASRQRSGFALALAARGKPPHIAGMSADSSSASACRLPGAGAQLEPYREPEKERTCHVVAATPACVRRAAHGVNREWRCGRRTRIGDRHPLYGFLNGMVHQYAHEAPHRIIPAKHYSDFYAARKSKRLPSYIEVYSARYVGQRTYGQFNTEQLQRSASEPGLGERPTDSTGMRRRSRSTSSY